MQRQVVTVCIDGVEQSVPSKVAMRSQLLRNAFDAGPVPLLGVCAKDFRTWIQYKDGVEELCAEACIEAVKVTIRVEFRCLIKLEAVCAQNSWPWRLAWRPKLHLARKAASQSQNMLNALCPGSTRALHSLCLQLQRASTHRNAEHGWRCEWPCARQLVVVVSLAKGQLLRTSTRRVNLFEV
jgi:hypothetical protein